MKRTLSILTLALMLSIAMTALPVMAQDFSIQDAAKEVETAISKAMSNSGSGSGPTLGQLGGVQGGSTASDAGGGAGGGDSSGGGSGGGGGCFAPETLVLMADGTSKPIKDVKVGDKVASWDFEAETQITATVSYVYNVKRDHYFQLDGFMVTAEHPFCTSIGKFTAVHALSAGDEVAEVTDNRLEFQPIQSIKRVDAHGSFHNMTVLPTNMYIVSPASRKRERETARAQRQRRGQWHLVHNKGGSTGL